jgi:hypothetical protein
MTELRRNRMMNKVLIGLLGAGVIATGGYAAATGIDDPAPVRTVSLPGATTGDTTTTTSTTTAATTTDDIVVGTAPATTTTTPTGTTGEDISGPCDEAEHANDPRCTGGATTDDDDGDDDRSGPNRGSDDDDHDNDDRSGSNSGSDHDNDNDD